MQVNGMLVIIGCGVAKRCGVHKAADLYTSGYFRLKLAYARTITDDDSILILSGKYGFTRLDQEIASYNQHISENGAISDSTLKQQARGIKVRGGDVIVLGGKDYVERIRPLWVDCKTPLSGGLPQQMKWLKAQVEGDTG